MSSKKKNNKRKIQVPRNGFLHDTYTFRDIPDEQERTIDKYTIFPYGTHGSFANVRLAKNNPAN